MCKAVLDGAIQINKDGTIKKRCEAAITQKNYELGKPTLPKHSKEEQKAPSEGKDSSQS
jgi:hypothetical protein